LFIEVRKCESKFHFRGKKHSYFKIIVVYKIVHIVESDVSTKYFKSIYFYVDMYKGWILCWWKSKKTTIKDLRWTIKNTFQKYSDKYITGFDNSCLYPWKYINIVYWSSQIIGLNMFLVPIVFQNFVLIPEVFFCTF
jgi:hypothetical protein